MKKTFVAYICIGLAVSFLIVYIILDFLEKDVVLEEIKVIKNISIKDEILVDDNLRLIKKLTPVSLEEYQASFFIKDIDENLFELMDGLSFHDRGHIKIQDLKLLHITYLDFNEVVQTGQMIVHYLVADEVLEIFKILYEQSYQIDKVNLVYNYQGSDDLSMADNNTHSFNDRMIGDGNRLSNHAFGLAIDINPIQNPYVKGSLILPPEGQEFLERNTYRQGMVLKGDVCYHAFIKRGWTWGGDWNQLKDYQHFEKVIPTIND